MVIGRVGALMKNVSIGSYYLVDRSNGKRFGLSGRDGFVVAVGIPPGVYQAESAFHERIRTRGPSRRTSESGHEVYVPKNLEHVFSVVEAPKFSVRAGTVICIGPLYPDTRENSMIKYCLQDNFNTQSVQDSGCDRIESEFRATNPTSPWLGLEWVRAAQ